jgi:hypothetical protein
VENSRLSAVRDGRKFLYSMHSSEEPRFGVEMKEWAPNNNLSSLGKWIEGNGNKFYSSLYALARHRSILIL